MKTFFPSLFVVFSLFACADDHAVAHQDEAGSIAKATNHAITAVLQVEGMTCRACENSINKTLKKLPGVSEVVASHQNKSVTVTFDKEKISLDEIKQAITDLGYQVD